MIRLILVMMILALLLGCDERGGDKQAAQTVPSPPLETAKPKPKQEQEPTKDAALAFSLTDLQGKVFTAADYRGKWLVLNYWATWCAPCRKEIPELVKFQEENPQVQILGIAYEDTEVEKLQAFVEEFKPNYPILTIDMFDTPKFAAEEVVGLPTTVIYTPEGLRHKKHVGPIDAAGLRGLIFGGEQ